MAEMTAAEALSTLVSLHIVGPYDLSGVIEVIEQQAAEIDRLNKTVHFEQNYLSRVGTHGPDCYKWGPGHWDCAMREIAKKAKMLDMVIKKLSLSDCPMDRSYDLACPKWTEDGAGCAACWLAWLEKEAEVQTDENILD